MSAYETCFYYQKEVELLKESTLQAKVQLVDEIKEKINNAQSVVLVDYRGLDVSQLTELRRNFREAGVEYKVYKNSMMRFAFKESGLEEFNEHLTGPNGIAFSYEDPVSVAKIASNFSKENKNLEIKAGIVDGKIINVEGVEALAELPSREVLVAQALGGLNAPIQGFANVLQGTMRALVIALNQIAEKQETA